jgi:hypothetical protein
LRLNAHHSSESATHERTIARFEIGTIIFTGISFQRFNAVPARGCMADAGQVPKNQFTGTCARKLALSRAQANTRKLPRTSRVDCMVYPSWSHRKNCPAEQSADIPTGKSCLTFWRSVARFFGAGFLGTLMMRGKVAAWIYASHSKGCSHSFSHPVRTKKGPRAYTGNGP